MPRSLLALVDDIYEAAVITERWPTVLEQLSGLAGAIGGVMFSASDHHYAWTASDTLRPEIEAFILGGWNRRNTRIDAALARGHVGRHEFIDDETLYSPDGPGDDPLYAEFFRPRGYGHSVGTAVALPHGDLLVISFERAGTAGRADRTVLDGMTALYPDIVRAAMLAGRLAFARVSGAVDMLTRVGLPTVAVDHRGRLVVASEGWDGDGLYWRAGMGDQVQLRDERAARHLRDILGTVERNAVGASIPVRDASGAHATVLQIIPIRREANDIFQRAAAVLVLTLPRRGAFVSPTLIQSLLDLTPAEAMVAAALARGLAPKAIARETGKSVDTVCNQVKAVMRKTGCKRVTDLVLMLAEITPRGDL